MITSNSLNWKGDQMAGFHALFGSIWTIRLKSHTFDCMTFLSVYALSLFWGAYIIHLFFYIVDVYHTRRRYVHHPVLTQ